jgi:hypothetical protein
MRVLVRLALNQPDEVALLLVRDHAAARHHEGCGGEHHALSQKGGRTPVVPYAATLFEGLPRPRPCRGRALLHSLGDP